MNKPTELLQVDASTSLSPTFEVAPTILTDQEVHMAAREAYASPLAREIIATNINTIRRKNDAITKVRKFGEVGWNARTVASVALGSHLLTAAAREDLSSNVKQVAVASIVGISTSIFHKLHHVKTESSIGKSLNRQAYGEMSEMIDYWTVDSTKGHREVVMCWAGAKRAISEEHTPELQSSLRLIAEIAKENNVSAVFVPTGVLQAVPAAESIGREFELQEWAARKKKIDINATKPDRNRAELKMLAFTPTELQSVSELVKNEEHVSSSVKRYIDAIRSVNHEHPIVRFYDKTTIFDEGFVKTLQRIAQKNIEMRLNDLEVRRMSDPFNPKRERVDISASYVQSKILWNANGKFDRSQTVNAAVGMTNKEAEEVIEIPEIHGASKVLLAAELLISQVEVASSDTPIVRYTPTASDFFLRIGLLAHNRRKTNFINIGESEDITVKRPPRFTRTRRLGIAAIAAAAVAVPVAQDVAIEQHESNIANIEADYRFEHDVESTLLTAKQKSEIEAEVEARHPYGSLYAKLIQAENNSIQASVRAISDAITSVASAGTVETYSDFPSTTTAASVGNITHETTEQALWTIDNPSNKPIDGYWSQSVATAFNQENDWHLIRPEDAGISAQEIVNNQAKFNNKDALVVSGRVNAVVYESLGSAVVPIPMLDGYKVVATNGNGWLFHTSGGGILLGFDNGGPIDVRYVLEEDVRLKNNERSQLYNPLPNYFDAREDEATQKLMDRRYLSWKVQNEWEQAIPNVYDLQGDEKIKAQIQYIKDNFHYELSPVPDDMVNSLEEGETFIDGFVRTQMAQQQANCNVAATMVAVSNPDVTPGVGFLNDGDGTLTDREAHMWLVDREGILYDPTPTRLNKQDGTNKVFLSFGSDYKSNLPRPEFAAIALLAALGLTQRRRATKAAHKAVIGTTSVASIRGSLQALDTALYAQTVSSGKPAAYLQSKSKEELLERLASPQYHDVSTKEHVVAISANLPVIEKRALKKARRLLKHVKAIRPIKMPQEDTGINSVL